MSRRSDGPDFASPKSQRSMSMNSDRPSLSGISTMPAGIHPLPAYVAASAASQMVTDHHIGEGEEGNGFDDGALFSEGALASLNAFLDHLLYSFLASAKSTSLAALRPAVTDTLKTRLARDAIASADEDLADLLSGTDDEDELSYIQNGADANAKWDLEMVWRRTRLRIMVYIRLGEMEDEDEERYLEEDEYFNSDNRRFSRSSGLVSWAAAIFLTSVIEYMAEQTIICAGKAAYTKALKRRAADARNSMETEHGQNRIIVEDSDMEKVALDSTLSRLWRTWRRRLKQPSSTASTPAPSRVGGRPGSISSPRRRNESIDGTDGGFSETDDFRTPSSLLEGETSKAAKVRTEAPENIPLPMGERDVDEIEVPGLARTFEDESDEEEDEEPPRRASFVTLMRSKDDSVAVQDDEMDERPILRRARSRSLPVPGAFTNDSLREQPYEKTPASVTKQSPEEEEKIGLEDNQKGNDKQSKRKSFLATGASMAAAGAAAAYGAVMGRGRRDEPTTPVSPVSPVSDDDKSFQAREAHSKEIDDVLDAQVLDSRRVSVIRPTDGPELVRHESGSSYSTSRSFSGSQKPQEIALENEKENQDESKNVSPLPKEKEKSRPGAIGVASTSDRPVSPPSPIEAKSSRIPAQQRASPDANDDARKLERIAKATAPAAVVSAVTGAGAAALAARKHPTPIHKATAQPWDEPSAEQFQAAQSLQGPVRGDSTTKVRKIPDTVVAQPAVDKDTPTPTPAKEKLRKPVPTESRALAPGRPLDRGHSSESVASSNSDVKVQPLAVKTKEKASSASPAEWSNHGSPTTRRPARGSKSSIDSLGDQHAQVTPISASSTRRRDFDSLVRGEETMKYTLTPQGMRDFENPPAVPAVKEADRSRYPAKSSRQLQEQSRSVEPVSSAQHTPEHNHPTRTASITNKTTSRTSDVRQSAHQSESAKSASRPPQRNYGTTRQGLVAREPQVQTVSTKDLADFFQTTAPEKEPDPVLPLLLSRSQSQPSTAGRKQLESSSGGKSDRRNSFNKSGSRGSVAGSKSGSQPPPLASPKRMNLQARDAVAPASGSSDLIDFIRQGPPPGLNGIGAPANQPQAFTPRNSNRDSSTIGTQSSARTSANSRTALVPQQNGTTSSSSSLTQPAHSSTKQSLAPPGAVSSLGASAPDLGKKRYRNKDPYAIDFDDDEDEDLLTALPNAGKPKRQEESLIDFLNSVEPPSLNAPKPILNGSQTGPTKGRKEQPNMGKKTESSTLKKTDVRSKSQPTVSPTEEKRRSNSATGGSRQNGTPNRDGILSTATHRPGLNGTSQPMNPLSMNAPNPTSNSATALPQMPNASSGAPRIPVEFSTPSGSFASSTDFTAANKPRPKIEARSPGVAKGAGSAARLDAFHTDDLADFLRSSGPPDVGAPAPVVGRAAEDTSARKRSDGKRRFPWQKKTYLDMP